MEDPNEDDVAEVVPLRIGDYITIRAASMGVDGFLGAEGILDQRPMVHTTPSNYDDCKWQICTPSQYSAAKELHEYEENMRALEGDDEASIASMDGNPLLLMNGGGGANDDGSLMEGESNYEDPAHQAEMLHQSLIRGKQSERALNASQFSRMTGTVIKFGETVQLRHVKSGRYLTVSQTEVATVEKENLKISLDQEGSSSSLLTLGTRFRIDRDGDPVNSQSELVFKVVEGQSMFLRFSVKDVPGQEKGLSSKECNCSLDKSFWKVVLFNSYKPPEDPDIMAGDIVRLFEPEFGAYMRLLPMTSSLGTADKARGDLFLETQSDSSTPDSNALWIVERKDASVGGGVVYRDEPFRFRHLNTGRYIGTRAAQMWRKATNMVQMINVRPASRSGKEAPDYVVTAKHKEHKSSSVTIHSAHQARSGRAGEGSIPVTDQSAVRLELGGRWLHRGERNAEFTTQFAEPGESLWSVYAQTNKTGPALLNLVVQRVDDEGTMLDALCGVCALPYLKRYSNLASKFRFRDVDDGVGHFRETIVTSLINYLYERPFSNSIQFAKAIPTKTGLNAVSEHRQMFLREQGVIAEVIDICELLLAPEWDLEEELKGLITRPCFTLLLNAIYCNPVNQMYVADRLKVFIGHVSSNYMATRCIMEMLATNMELQESKVNEPEVANFIDMIANSRMAANYVKLLQSVCSCQGRGVDVNQCMVADMWLEGSKHLQVKFKVGEGERKMVSWKRALPTEIANKGYKYIKGYDVHKKGVPEIFLTWETEFPELTPDALGGQGGTIPLLKIFKNTEAETKKKHGHHHSHKALVNPVQKMRAKVAEYIVAQLLLAAEVCLDRNYIAMGMCVEAYPFELLLGILKTDDVAESLRAAVVRLMMCLYVDADPQANLRIPCLTRRWDEVTPKGEKILMPSVEKVHLFDFFLLQDYVWEHMHEMEGHASWEGSELKHGLMALLLKLVQFRYYQDPEDVINLVVPLVASLDNRSIIKVPGRPETPSDGAARIKGASSGNLKVGAIVPVDGLDMPSGGIQGPQRFPLVGPGTSRPDDFRAKKFPFLCGIMGPDLMTPLEQLDTIVALSVILFLTFAGIISDMILKPNGVIPDLAADVFSYFCSFCFTLELSSRMICYKVITGPILPKMCRPSSAQYEGPAPVFLCDPLSVLDFLVVFIDIVFIIIDILTAIGVFNNAGAEGASLTRTLRLARLTRLTRILKGARLAHKIKTSMNTTDIDDWQLPARYENTSELHMSTMLETVNVLREITKITRDYSMSQMMSSYRQWYEGKDSSDPQELFNRCYEDTKSSLSLEKNTSDFDLIFLDLCLYKHHDLVQSVLNVMMIHHNLREIMLNDFTSSQLLVKDVDQDRVLAFRKDLAVLRSDAERAELWSELNTADDRKVNERLKDSLVRLTDQIKVRSSKLRGYQQIYRSDSKVQDMLRNLGAFEVCMTVLELDSSLKEVEEDEAEAEAEAVDGPEGTRAKTPERIPTAEAIKKRQEDEKTKMVNNNILEILNLCYEFMSWFVHDNDANQNLAFTELETFEDALGDGCGAHKLIAETVRGNPTLIKAFPSKLISKCAYELSITPDPGYLSILEALVWQSSPDALGNLPVQVSILKHLTTPEFQENIMLVCAEPDSQLYAERKEWMKEAMENTANQPSDGSGSGDPAAHMPSLLQYHSMLLYVLAGTAVGRTNITTVEAKLQTIYKPDDLLSCLLDPDTTIDVLIPVSNYFFHAVIEVEIAIPGLGQHRSMWQYLKVCDEVIANSKDDFDFLSENPLDESLKAVIARRNCEYALICVRIVLGFFDAYFDRNQMDPDFTLEAPPPPATPMERQMSTRRPTSVGTPSSKSLIEGGIGAGSAGGDFEFADGSVDMEGSMSDGGEDSDSDEETDTSKPTVRMWWDDILSSIRMNLTDLYQLKPKVLLAEHFSVMYSAIEVITGACQEQDVDILMLETPDMLRDLAGSFDQSDESGGGPKAAEELSDRREDLLAQFVEQLTVSDDLAEAINSDKDNMVESMEKIPSMSEDDTKGDLRFEPLLKKLVRHTRSNLVTDSGFKTLDVDCTKSTKWFIQLFRRMIEKRWGMTIDERDEDGGEEEDEKAEPVQMMLNVCGVTELCLDLIAVGINGDLVKECVKLLVALLFKEGGATKVQMTIFKHLSTTNTQLFFEEMVSSLNIMEEIFKYDELPGFVAGSEGSFAVDAGKSTDAGDEKPDDGDEDDEEDDPLAELPIVGENLICVRFLQLMCEGHYGPNQDIMREQLGSGRVSVNLLDHMVRLLQVASKKKCRASTKCAAQVTDTILEVIQGPCIQNQNHLAINTELIEILNRMMRAKPINDCVQDEEDEVQLTVLNIFEGLLEGQPSDSQIYDRILSVIDLSVLQVMIVANGGTSDEMNDVQIEGLVLLQMLCDYKPALKAEVNLPERVLKVMGKDVMSVEVVWNHELQRRFFHVPEIAANLAEATKKHLVENNNRASQEEKLGDFVSRIYGVQRELKHQEMLRDLNYISLKCPPWSEDGRVLFHVQLPFSLAALFSRQNQERATWISFFCCLLINIIMLISFEHIELWAQGDEVYNEREGMRNNNNIGDDDAQSGLDKVWFSGVLANMTYISNPTGQREGQILCDAKSMYDSFKIIKTEFGSEYFNHVHDPFELGLLDYDGGIAACDPPVLDGWLKDIFPYGKSPPYDPNGEWSSQVGTVGFTAGMLGILNTLNKTLAIFTLVLYLAVRCPVRYAETYERTKQRLFSTLVAITDPMTMYYFIYVVIAFQAGDYPIYQSYLLIDVVVKDSTTMSVLLAVIIPWKQLTATLVLLVFITYMFAYIIFLGYANEMSAGAMDCSTLGKCLWANIDYGMRLSGGIGDNMTHEIEFDRSVFDYLYFLVVLVILLNVVFGIIIDTFSDLRSQKNDRIADTVGKCFICGIDKLEFDRADDTGASGFKRHISNDHNMWNYLYFIIFIWEQDKDDDDGLELYVREMIEQEDISWFPVNKAICLQLGAEDEQDASHKLDALNTTMHDLVREQGEMLLRVLEENRQTSMREMANIRQRLDAINLHNKEGKENVEKLRESQKMMHESLENLTVDGSSTDGGGGGGGMPPSFSSPMKAQPMPSINLMSQVNESPAEQPATNSSRRQSELDASQTITVCVTNCQDLVVPHLLGSADPFVVANVFWNGVKVGETETIWYGTPHPAWKNVGRNTFKITISKNDDVRAGKLSVEVNHTHRRGAGSFLGVAEVTGQQIMGAGDSSPTTMHRLLRKPEQHLPRSKQLNVQGSVGLKLRLK